jgi:hypothetical protein
LGRRSYLSEQAFGTYQEFAQKDTEKTRLQAWDALLPLIPIRYHLSKFCRITRKHSNLAEADDLFGEMGWKIWKDLPRIRKVMTFESRRHYTGFMIGVVRFGFLEGVQHMNKGYILAIEPDHMRLYEGRSDRSFAALENRLYLEDLPIITEKWMMRECWTRFDERFRQAVRYCLRLQFREQRPQPMVLRDVWLIEDTEFVWDWTKVKLREFLTGQRDIFRSTGQEDFFDRTFAQ